MSLPLAVAVSSPMPRMRSDTPLAVSRSTMPHRSRMLRASRSSLVTTSTSPSRA